MKKMKRIVVLVLMVISVALCACQAENEAVGSIINGKRIYFVNEETKKNG